MHAETHFLFGPLLGNPAMNVDYYVEEIESIKKEIQEVEARSEPCFAHSLMSQAPGKEERKEAQRGHGYVGCIIFFLFSINQTEVACKQ
jgi:hypothetical protein